MNDKAVSPLIATIFLIAVSVALGSIVMSLGEDYVSEAQPQAQFCQGIDYEVKRINYDPEQNFLQITIDNEGEQIDGFVVKYFDSSFSKAQSLKSSTIIGEHDAAVLKLFIEDFEDLYEVKVTPITNEDVCTQDARELSRNSPLFSIISS